MAVNQALANRIASAIRGAGVTQGRVADHLGVSRVAVNARMNGRTRWSVDDVLALTDLLGCHLSDLLEERA